MEKAVGTEVLVAMREALVEARTARRQAEVVEDGIIEVLTALSSAGGVVQVPGR